jgi:hypothetical protein
MHSTTIFFEIPGPVSQTKPLGFTFKAHAAGFEMARNGRMKMVNNQSFREKI